MQIMIECPDVMFAEVEVAAAMTGLGARLEAVEDVPAGPWLGVLLASIDRSKLTEWDLPAYLRAVARHQAWSASMLAEGIAELDARAREFGVDFGPDKEVALALRESVGAAQRRIWQAKRLRRLPTLRQLFTAGAVSEKQVLEFIEATGRVDDPDLLANIEERVLTRDGALAKTGRELRRAARQVVNRLDPAGALARTRAAREDADVVLQPDEDGMADVVIHAPVEQAVAVKTAGDAYAATQKAAGDPRRVGVLRAEGVARICEGYLTGSGSAGGGKPRSGGRPIEIGIVIGLDTALGRRDLPGEIPGVGIVPREVIAKMVTDEGARLRLMIVDETTGRLVHRAHDAYRPTPEQIAHVRSEYVHSVGPGSHVLAARTDIDHSEPWPVGETVIGKLIPNDRTWHNGHTKKQLAVKVDDNGSVIWTSVLGQSRTVTPFDYRLEEPTGEPADDSVDEPPGPVPPPF
jgi:hypothetical protein